MLENFARDFRHAARLLIRQPGFAIPVVLTFALGIGAVSAIFSVVYTVLLRPLPYELPESLMVIWENDLPRGSKKEGASMPDLLDWQERQKSFAALAGFRVWEGNLNEPGATPERVIAGEIGASFFSLFGIEPTLGRGFALGEDEPGGENVAVLGHDFWRQRFAGSEDAVGRSIFLDGEGYRVIGVLPSTFVSPAGRREVLYVPLRRRPEIDHRGRHDIAVFARLASGVSAAAGQEEMKAIMARLAEENPEENQGRSAVVVSLYEEIVGQARGSLVLLFGAALVLLLCTFVNITNLLLARALSRRREVALRAALGSQSGRLFSQFLAEGLFLSLAGAAIGLLLARWGIRILLALSPEGVPRAEGVALHLPVLGLALLITLVAALGCSLIPVLHARRVDLRETLQDAGTTTVGDRRQTLRRLLVVGEVALAVVLVIGAGLLMRSLYKLLDVELGFRPGNVVTMQVTLPQSRYAFPSFSVYPQWPELAEFYRRYLEEARAVPGVESVAIAVNHPLAPGFTTTIEFKDRPGRQPGEPVEERVRPISPDYLDATGIRLLKGRAFDDRDDADHPPVVIINQSFARRHYRDDPIGKTFSFWGREREIVGVVEDVRFLGLGEDVPPAVYPPFLQAPMANFFIVARGAVDAKSVVLPVRDAVWSQEPTVAVYDIATLDERMDASVSEPRFTMMLIALFASVALLLAAVGIYGLMSFSVAQRRTEIGVRMALGGNRADMIKLILGEGLRLLIGGLVVGLVLSLAFTRLLRTLLFGVGTADPAVYTAVLLILFLTGLLACLVPILRATRINPIVALRYE